MKSLKKSLAATFAAATLLTLSGCAGIGIDKSQQGFILGGVLGGLAGDQLSDGNTAITIGVALLGAAIGQDVGRTLDNADKAAAARAFNRASTTQMGNTIRWNGPRSGNSGTYTPTRDGYTGTGQYCREYQTTVTIGGNTEKAYGTACRQPDGSWKMN